MEPEKFLVLLPGKYLEFCHFLPRSWQFSCHGSLDFARSFLIVETDPRNFSDFLARKPRVSKVLAREPKKIIGFFAKKTLDF